MKLRLVHNSLRLRLGRSEVAQLSEIGRVEERIEFAPAVDLTYAIESRDDVQETAAKLEAGRITVRIPRSVANEWIATDLVGISGKQAALSILIEKDFPCVHGESNPDAFTGLCDNSSSPTHCKE